MVHYITISGGIKLTIPQYCKIVKLAKNNPERQFERSFCGWWTVDGHEILRQFRKGINDRINSKLTKSN